MQSDVILPCHCRVTLEHWTGERLVRCSCGLVWNVEARVRYTFTATDITPDDVRPTGARKVGEQHTYQTVEDGMLRVVCSVHHCRPTECFDLHHATSVAS